MNTVNEIKNYILEHIHIESPEVWEFEISPQVTKLINSLNQNEINEFSNCALEWDDEILYLITLSFHDVTNIFLDVTEMYINIFCKIKNIEFLELLVENDIPFIRPPYDTIEKLKDWNIEQLKNLKENIEMAMTIKSESWNETLNEVVAYLNKQIVIKASR